MADFEHAPSPFAVAVNDDQLRTLVIAHALVWVAEKFDEFRDHLIKDHEGKDDFNVLNSDLFDIFIMPIVREAARTQFGAVNLSGLSNLMDSLIKGE